MLGSILGSLFLGGGNPKPLNPKPGELCRLLSSYTPWGSRQASGPAESFTSNTKVLAEPRALTMHICIYVHIYIYTHTLFCVHMYTYIYTHNVYGYT